MTDERVDELESDEREAEDFARRWSLPPPPSEERNALSHAFSEGLKRGREKANKCAELEAKAKHQRELLERAKTLIPHCELSQYAEWLADLERLK